MAKAKPAKTKSKTASKAAPAKPAAKPPAPKAPKVAPARLGDDMPVPSGPVPKLSREPLALIVAKTDIAAGKARIRGMAATIVRVARGQVVHVKHAYRLQEHSEEREEYRFLLKSNLGSTAKPPSLARFGDQWGIPEDISGYLQHEYVCNTPGRHTLNWDVGSEYCVMGWGNDEVKALDREDLKGALEIIVL